MKCSHLITGFPQVARLLPIVAVLLMACSSQQSDPPEDFREAFAALDQAFSKETLERSSFAARFPDPTPKQVVSFLLSQAGAEVLIVSSTPLGEEIDPFEKVAVWPRGITLWYAAPKVYGYDKQVIPTWNDPAKTITASAYVNPDSVSVFSRSWEVVPLTKTREQDPADTREFQAF